METWIAEEFPRADALVRIAQAQEAAPRPEPLRLALNVIPKILCFVAAIMLFVRREDDEGSLAGAR